VGIYFPGAGIKALFSVRDRMAKFSFSHLAQFLHEFPFLADAVPLGIKIGHGEIDQLQCRLKARAGRIHGERGLFKGAGQDVAEKDTRGKRRVFAGGGRLVVKTDGCDDGRRKFPPFKQGRAKLRVVAAIESDFVRSKSANRVPLGQTSGCNPFRMSRRTPPCPRHAAIRR